ncbi:MAG: mannose-6-phosphate isomerase-like protein (cupin superfamily) [Alphaproteobacteria bacterium]|jgi:mannose-6-phosphate isomerase-like protein (cupin superfamily)
MAVQFRDLIEAPELEVGHSKDVLFSSDQFHTWVHGDYPGTKGPMHKHTADQFFYCVQGQCTFHFPDGELKAINPGQLMVIPKDHLYQLDNTGDEYMILLGARAEPSGNKRYSATDKVVPGNSSALKDRDKSKAPADKI